MESSGSDGGWGGHFEQKKEPIQKARGRKGLGSFRILGKGGGSRAQSPEGCAKELGFYAQCSKKPPESFKGDSDRDCSGRSVEAGRWGMSE